MADNPKAKPSSVLLIALQIAAWTGGSQTSSVAVSTARTDATLSQRVEHVRELLAQGAANLDKAAGNAQPLQWVNWVNWQNWGNWPNWNNWLNWVKY
jgi:hypothetical protein